MQTTITAASSKTPSVSNLKITEASSKSRFIGATLIIAGTTVGAGMLALPITSHKAGFLNSALLLISMWAFTCFAALVSVEINLHYGAGYSISYLAEKNFGKLGKWIASLSIGFLFYALLSAYTAGGATFLKAGLESIFTISLPFPIIALAFATTLAFFVYSSTRHVDLANRFLLFFKISIFLLLAYLLTPFVRAEYLQHTNNTSVAIWLAIPIFFTSFGFHGSIPTLINYVGPNPTYLRRIIIIGSLPPLIIYLLWQTVTLGVINPVEMTLTNGKEQNVAFFIQHLNQATQSNEISYFSNIFAFFGVSTSFLGVAIGLFDYLTETLKKTDKINSKLQTALLTFLPPLFFAIFYPDGFIIALGYAAIALSTLAILLPVMVAYKLRLEAKPSNYTVAGGNVALALLFCGGISIIVIELIK